MKVTNIPIVIGDFSIVTKWLLKGLEDLEVGRRVETTQTTRLLGTARILRRVLVTWGYLVSLKLQWKTIADVKNSDNYNMLNIQTEKSSSGQMFWIWEKASNTEKKKNSKLITS